MPKTHFGFETVELKDKQKKIDQVFDSVVDRYDLMNDLMSAGLQRIWKYQAINALALKQGDKVLDLASGTCDLSLLASKIVGKIGLVISTDINLKMLRFGRAKLLNQGIKGHYLQMDAQKIAFKQEVFDAVMIGFGLRNFPDKTASFLDIHRVLKTGAKLMILEFSKVQSQSFVKAYKTYRFNILPILGSIVAKDKAAYQYLAESIEKHPSQQQITDELKQAGFSEVKYQNLMDGLVAIHTAYK